MNGPLLSEELLEGDLEDCKIYYKYLGNKYRKLIDESVYKERTIHLSQDSSPLFLWMLNKWLRINQHRISILKGGGTTASCWFLSPISKNIDFQIQNFNMLFHVDQFQKKNPKAPVEDYIAELLKECRENQQSEKL